VLGLVAWRAAFARRLALGTISSRNAGETVMFVEWNKVLGLCKFIEKETGKVDLRRISVEFHVVIVIVSCVNTHKLLRMENYFLAICKIKY